MHARSGFFNHTYLITYIYILPLHIQTYHQSSVHVRNNINRYSNSRDIIQNHQT